MNKWNQNERRSMEISANHEEIARYSWKRGVQGQWNQLCLVLMQMRRKIKIMRRSRKAIRNFLLALVSFFCNFTMVIHNSIIYPTGIGNNYGKSGIPGISAYGTNMNLPFTKSRGQSRVLVSLSCQDPLFQWHWPPRTANTQAVSSFL